MKPETDKLFVYGTLMQGEERCAYLRDCDFLGSASVPGAIYDTGRGYPAALFDETSAFLVAGEIYILRDPARKLNELDEVEGVSRNQYNRVLADSGGEKVYSYEPGQGLTGILEEKNRIRSGIWRPRRSMAVTDPVTFALGFEEIQRSYYREPVSSQREGLVYHPGTLPALITAPHASVHRRMGKLKRQEFFTGAIAVSLHSITGAHVLFTNALMERDPNFYDDSPFKSRMESILRGSGIRLVLDIHGTGTEKKGDIYPGVGRGNEYLFGNGHYLDLLGHHAERNSLRMGGTHVFPAVRQMTVAKYAAGKLNIPAMQIEINKRLRDPEKDPESYISLLYCLSDFIAGLGLSG